MNVMRRMVKIGFFVVLGVATVGCCFNPLGRGHGGYQGGGGGGEHHQRGGERGR